MFAPLVAVLLAVTAAPQADEEWGAEGAPEPAPAKTSNNRAGNSSKSDTFHTGFMLRLELGTGYATHSFTYSQPVLPDFDASGGTLGQFGLVLGGAIAENLVLGGILFGQVADKPTVKVEGREATSDSTMNISGIGPTLVWYHGGTNIFLDASLMALQHSADAEGRTVTSDTGVGFRLGVGKEWRVSESWGLGAALHYLYGNTETKESELTETITSSSFGLTFSATYF